MTRYNYLSAAKGWLLMLALFVFSSCKQEPRVVELFEKGELVATASASSILAGESVTFTDNSTKVQTRLWEFPGGTPESSIAPNVSVTYESGGTFEATLLITFVDNTTEEKTFTIEVEGTEIPQDPYLGAPVILPGTIEAENYDLGGEGVAYHDAEEENRAVTAGSPVYRDDDGVDIEVGAVTNIGYVSADEWVEYTVDVLAAETYDFHFVVASSPGSAGAIMIQREEADGSFADLGELPVFAGTGGWQVYDTLTVSGISLNAGSQVLRFYFGGGGINLDKVIVGSPNVGPVTRLGIYTERAVDNTVLSEIQINNAFVISTITNDVFEGNEALEFRFDAQDTWGVMGSIKPSDGTGAGNFNTVDISAFVGGFYNITLRTTCTLKMNLRLQGGGVNGYVQLDDAVKTYGFERDGQWHTLRIPLADFKTDGGDLPDYSQISDLLVLRSAEPSVTAGEDWDWYVDDVYLSK